ncbi:hypothetical protein PFISCL1PPCAC_14755, partial [Pristionchus fissidentatus]
DIHRSLFSPFSPMISHLEESIATQTANTIEDQDMAVFNTLDMDEMKKVVEDLGLDVVPLQKMDNINVEDMGKVVKELGLDNVPAHKMDNMASFLEASNDFAQSAETRPVVRALRRQLHSMYVFDESEEGVKMKSEYEMNKFDSIVFEKDGEIKSEYIGLEEESKTTEADNNKFVTAGNEVSLQELNEKSAVNSTYTAQVYPSADNISSFKPEGGVLDPCMQVNRERLFGLLLAYQSQNGSPWNETITGLGR